jgi:hypothetical protein
MFADYFSARWTRTINFAAGTYRFMVNNIDDGVRLYVGGQKIIDRWVDASGTNTAVIILPAGNHTIMLEYYEHVGPARVNLSWGAIPNPPLALMASPASEASDTSINLVWLDNSTNESGFEIERWNGSSWALISTVGPNAITYTDPGRALATTYTYRVRAFNDVGVSGYSNDSSATTFLPAPLGLGADPLSASQIKLTWIDRSSLEDGFKIERWNGSSYAQIDIVGANINTYINSGLAPSTTYLYRVRAFSNIGVDSGYSIESSATTPACSYSLNPTRYTAPAGGGIVTVTVTTSPGCSWTAHSNNSWIRVFNQTSGSGNGTVTLVVDDINPDVQLSGSATIAGITFGVLKARCPSPGTCL